MSTSSSAVQKISDGYNNITSSLAIGTIMFFGERQENETAAGVFAITHPNDQEEDLLPSSSGSKSEPIPNALQAATSMAMTFLEESERNEVNGSLELGLNIGPTGDLVDIGGGGAGNDTSDMSYWAVRDPLYILIPITVIYVIILAVGLLGNVVTCIVIIRSRYLHTTTNLYLFSLAISDLLLLLSGLPAEMHSIWWRYPYVFGEAFCVIRGLAAEVSTNATVLTITAFTIERYLAICRPFMIQKWQNKLSRVVRQILVIWMIAVCFAVPQALQFGLDTIMVGPNKTAVTCGVKKVLIEHSFEIATFVFFVAPMVLISLLYCLIGITLRNASRVKESKLRLRKSLSGHKREQGQQRVLKMLVMIVICFFCCWLPFHAQRLIAIWGTKYLQQSEVLRNTYHILTYVSGVLYYLSTCVNPIVYSVMSLKFRRAFQACCSCTQPQENYNSKDNVNKCCADQQAQRKERSEVLVTINHRSISHSSRSQANIVLTEVTTLSNLGGNFVQPIHHNHNTSSHHQHHLSFSPSVLMKTEMNGGVVVAPSITVAEEDDDDEVVQV